ncbi:MAG: NusG domain II-containing protein [bacterium]|nr:NusG domain II-containing protein [bacterium]
MNEKNTVPSKTFKKADLLLIGVLLLVALSAFGIRSYVYHSPAARVEITVDGELYASLDLHQNFEGDIPSADGGNNHLIIHDGTVHISDANCPNQDCVRQGSISQNGEQLVCLPHKVSVQILGD